MTGTNMWEDPEWIHYWGLEDYDEYDPFYTEKDYEEEEIC